MKALVNSKGLEMEVIESVPVHEDIKLRQGNYQLYIDNYKEKIQMRFPLCFIMNY